MSNSFSGVHFTQRPSSGLSSKPASPKKYLSKRKSLLAIVQPWLSYKEEEDIENDRNSNIIEASTTQEENGVKLVEYTSDSELQPNIKTPSNNNIETIVEETSIILDNSFESRNSEQFIRNETVSQSPTSINNLKSEIDKLKIANVKLVSENKLYDLEINKALNLNLELEYTVTKLESALNDQSLIIDKSVILNEMNERDYKLDYEDMIRKYSDLKIQKESMQVETDDLVQNYNSLVDKYFQLKEIHTMEKV